MDTLFSLVDINYCLNELFYIFCVYCLMWTLLKFQKTQTLSLILILI